MKKEKTIFNFINAINYKDKVEYDKKIAPAFMLSMWFSHDSKLLSTINKINEIQFSIPDEMVYKYFYYKVPRGKRFLKWTKKDKKEASKKLTEVLNKLNETYNISKKEFSYYRELILEGHEVDTKKSADVVDKYF